MKKKYVKLEKYSGVYNTYICNDGYVYSDVYGGSPEEEGSLFRKSRTLKKGILTSKIKVDSKRHLVRLHYILAENFIPNPNNYKYVLFKDGDSSNISLDNLYWHPNNGKSNKGCFYKDYKGEVFGYYKVLKGDGKVVELECLSCGDKRKSDRVSFKKKICTKCKKQSESIEEQKQFSH